MQLLVTDEDVALWAPSDFALLGPRDQRLASGLDGIFQAGDRWALRSSSSDFASEGLESGQVIQLLGPASTFQSPGELLAVQAVEPDALQLRRKGQAAGVGQPPSPSGGVTGVEFLVATLGPQIADARDHVSIRLGLDDPLREAAAGTSSLREAVVLTVLARLYFANSRDPGTNPDFFAAKAVHCEAALEALLARIATRIAGPVIVAEPSPPKLGRPLAR